MLAALVVAVLLPLSVAIGAGSLVTPILLIATVCLVVVLIALDKIAPKYYPFYIFGITLGLMYQASMLGAHVIGSDMHQEFYVSNQVLNGWNPALDYGSQSSTSIVVGWFVPFLSKLFHLDIVWIYKAVLPFIFSFTPLVLYYAFRRQLSPKIAFYSCMFFMIVPVASLEIVQIGKSMVAEVFFALVILLMVSTWKYRLPLIVLCLIGAILSHYTVGLMAVSYLVVALVVRLLSKIRPMALFNNARVPIALLLGLTVIGASVTYSYYSYADGGLIKREVERLIPGYSRVIKSTANSIAFNGGPILDVNSSDGGISYMKEQSPLVQAAIGMDFARSTVEGKTFRIVQYLTQVLIIIGAFTVLIRRVKFTAEFIACIGASFLLLLAIIFVPHFSNIINTTRFYQISLFFIAPLFVLGVVAVTKNRWAVPVVLLSYFVFTSGLVFEAMKSDNINRFDVPYSIGLSAQRTGVVANYTKDDVNAAKWLEKSDESYRIVGDYNGYRLMMGYIPINPRLRTSDEYWQPTLDALPRNKSYVLVTSWNTEHKQFITNVRTILEGSGLREALPLPKFDYPIVYRSGDTLVYEVR